MACRKVFVLVDGSKPASRALQWYLDEVSREGDEVHSMHVAEFNYGIGLPGAAVDVEAILEKAKKHNEKIETMMNSYLDQLRSRHVKGHSRVLTGNKPGEAIMKVVDEEKPNMIIMGSRGLGAVGRAFLGSVSEYIIRSAPPNCSVTIIRDS